MHNTVVSYLKNLQKGFETIILTVKKDKFSKKAYRDIVDFILQ